MSFRQEPVRNGAAYMDFGDGTETRVHPMTCICGCNLDVTVDPWTCPECGWQQGVDPRDTRSMLDIKGIKERLEKVPEALSTAYTIAENFKQCVFDIWALKDARSSSIATTYHNANCGPTNRALKEIAEQAPTDIKALLEEVERLRKVAEQAIEVTELDAVTTENFFRVQNKPELAAYLKERVALSGETDGAA